MPHSYVSNLMHCVFSTKERRRLITPDIHEHSGLIWAALPEKTKLKMLAVGGVEDHVHLLLSIPSTMAIAKAMQLIKGGSLLWMHDTFPTARGFAWQEGYGAFSISVSHVKDTTAYIHGQAEHHRKVSFQDEFRAFLKKHGIEYDERYIWG